MAVADGSASSELGGRWGWRVVAYVSDGTGAFLVAVAAILIAGFFFSGAFRTQEHVRETFQRLVRQESEPFRGESYQVAAAAVLNELEQDGPTVRSAIQRSLQEPWDRGADPLCRSRAWSEFAQALQRVRDGFGRGDRCSRSTLGVAPAGRDMRDSEAHCPAADIRYAALNVPWDHVLQVRDAAKVYFISMNGLVYSSNPLRSLRDSYAFAGASYVREVVADHLNAQCAYQSDFVKLYRSKIYIDVTGDGLVRTYCAPISMHAAGGGEARSIGAYCMDIALDANLIRSSVRRLQHVFEAATVILHEPAPVIPSGDKVVYVQRCQGACLFAPPSAELINAIQDHFDHSKNDTVVRQTSGFERDPGYVLLVPARRKQVKREDDGSQDIEAIVLTPADVNVIDLGWLMIGLAFLVIAGAVVFLASMRQRERERLRILHGLPVPVVVTRGVSYVRRSQWRTRLLTTIARLMWLRAIRVERDADAAQWDEILFANAAAESLLDRKLPRFPVGLGRTLQIGSTAAAITACLHHWLQGGDRTTYEQQTQSRGFAQESEYEVTLKMGRNCFQRIRIRGAWIQRSNGDIDTFGVVLPSRGE